MRKLSVPYTINRRGVYYLNLRWNNQFIRQSLATKDPMEAFEKVNQLAPLFSNPQTCAETLRHQVFEIAGINAFDLEIAETDVNKFCGIIAALEPTFGGINLEDIKAPECFAIEENLRKRMKIPVFHDDQHETAIVAAATKKNLVVEL
mgnify:CR=1 FL=1